MRIGCDMLLGGKSIGLGMMKIVVADDHGLFRDGLVIQLRRICENPIIDEAETYGGARLAVEGDRTDYLLIDLMMPGLHWRQELPDLVDRVRPGRCVVLSAIDDPGDIADAMAMGIAGFIPKRSDPRIIAHALRLVFDGGVYVPPEYMACGHGEGRGGARPALAPHLTPRQRSVLKGICGGLSNKQIAHQLSMSEATVKQHINAVLRALGAHNRTEAAMAAQRMALLDDA